MGEKIGKCGSVECSHVLLLLHAKQPRHFDIQGFCESDKLEVENAANPGFNLRDSSAVNGNT